MLKTDKIKKGDLVVRTYRCGSMLDKTPGVVLRLDQWVQTGLRAKVHFMDGFEMWVGIERLEKLNK